MDVHEEPTQKMFESLGIKCIKVLLASIKHMQIAKPKLVNTHDPYQNAIVRSQRVNFSADLAHSQKFFIRKIFI